jgi:hypothetical protein
MAEDAFVELGGAIAAEAPDNLREVVAALGTGEGSVRKSWFTRLVTAYLRYRATHRHRHNVTVRDGSEQATAEAIVRGACVKAAATGVGSGLITTGAALVATNTSVNALVVTVPAALVGIGTEMIGRTLIHLDMTCDIAAVFGMSFDPDDPADFWQLYGLAFRHHEHEDESDPGAELVHRVAHTEFEDVGEALAGKVLGESVLKNLIPVLGIATSGLANWQRTRKLGDTVRRYVRYKRALEDALRADRAICEDHLDLLIEGLWFIFTADGRLNDEETTLLASLLRDVPAGQRKALVARFTQDEADWLARLPAVPEPVRAPLLHALEVAAAVDKSVSLPEQKILARAARSLGLSFDLERVQAMIRAFEEVGVLARDVRGRWLGRDVTPGRRHPTG